MKKKEYLKVVLILPGNVLITIPILIFLFTRKNFSYDIIGPNGPIFYFAVFFLLITNSKFSTPSILKILYAIEITSESCSGCSEPIASIPY